MHSGQYVFNRLAGVRGVILRTLPQKIAMVQEDDGPVTVQFQFHLERCGETRPMEMVEEAVALLKKPNGRG
jgi:hypothetical protein